jgi:hypothetical protein
MLETGRHMEGLIVDVMPARVLQELAATWATELGYESV